MGVKMKRFYLITAIATICASLSVILIDSLTIIIPILFSIFIIVASLLIKRIFAKNYIISAVCFSLTFIIAFSIFSINSRKIDRIEQLSGESAVVNGTLLTDFEDMGSYYRYTFKIDRGELQGINSSFKINLTSLR